MRGEGGIRKSKVVKAIYLGFSFFKKRSKLVIAVPTEAIVANMRGATIYGALNIDEHMKNKN